MTLTTQFLAIISMIGAGIYLGAAIDTFRRYEPFWKKRVLFAYVIEICFWLLQTLILFYVLYLVNEGELRFYILLAVICGFAAYKSLFQTMYRKLLEWWIRTVISVYNFLKRVVQAVIIRPVKGLIRVMVTIILWLWGIILWILWAIFKVVWTPIKGLLVLLWRLVPKKVKNYFAQLAGFFTKIKNKVMSWYNFVQEKKRR